MPKRITKEYIDERIKLANKIKKGISERNVSESTFFLDMTIAGKATFSIGSLKSYFLRGSLEMLQEIEVYLDSLTPESDPECEEHLL